MGIAEKQTKSYHSKGKESAWLVEPLRFGNALEYLMLALGLADQTLKVEYLKHAARTSHITIQQVLPSDVASSD